MAMRLLASVTTRGFNMTVEMDDPRETLRYVTAAKEAAAKPRAVLRIWRSLVLARMKERIERGEGPSGKPLAQLSLASTVPIRQRRDLSRLSPKRFGGDPPLPLLTRLREYLTAWSSSSKGAKHRPTDEMSLTGTAPSWTIGVNHIAVINEYARYSKGAIPDKRVPARSVAYIRGDKKLLDSLTAVFAKHIEKALERARPTE